MVWDINTKFSPVSVLIRFQLFTKFERHSLKNEAAMPLTNKDFSRAWQEHFEPSPPNLANLFLFGRCTNDITTISGYIWLFWNWKNEKAFLSRYSELFVWNNCASFDTLLVPKSAINQSTDINKCVFVAISFKIFGTIEVSAVLPVLLLSRKDNNSLL